MVKLDYDEELVPLHGIYGSMQAEFEALRTFKRAEMTAFLCLLRKVIGPIKVQWKCIDPKAGDADLRI